MKRRTALGLPLLLAAGPTLSRLPLAGADPGRWSIDRVNRWYQAQGWPVGSNYITSTAVNQLEMFQAGTFDLQRIDNELSWAHNAGFNTMRVFLHDQLWANDRKGFQYRLAQFVSVAARRRIKPLFVLFDSCWDPHPKSGQQLAPRPGIHNSRWVQSPGAERLGDRNYYRTMYDYVTGVMTQFRYDDRVLGWDLWNEPDNMAREYSAVERSDKLDLISDLLPQVFSWARSVDARQPLTSGIWEGSREGSSIVNTQLGSSDFITFHSYDRSTTFNQRIAELAPLGRPIMCTEYLARTRGSTIDDILPIMKRHNVGAYNWGFVAGRTQTYLPWDSWDSPYTTAPQLWFHDLVQPSGLAYRNLEIMTISNLTGR
ncbi:cellulase family glycosylhydrolase [Mycolicibacter sp. MYC123]|uniref:Cellulase family glycosylhydrolase n=2 Tax=Mycolicibacter TaxID=1073531 RepID=A0ABU5YMZ1_9MYCO|nr:MULTISPECIES: cellulase family glycosylhydrolase [unclassified Mycolicibacter]MEB3051206.1 cellulase family glycosylhydrolase [Mycolicibacter sp. MYC123]MEB3061485.1 cellulase family glycosylhydrolase [Mycolicibacter sp. MYC101]MEB3067836.1 cellulase family glycosylhydrolase [Mycolicibacter sp. MYC017]